MHGASRSVMEVDNVRKRLPAPELEQPFYESVEAGARQHFMSLTAYQKFALLNQVKADGLDPSRPTSPARPAAGAAAERHIEVRP
jgi:hypothetical protein